MIEERGLAIELPNLTHELHRCIQELYYQGSIRFMHSCLKELIDTSIQSFIKLGLGETQSYNSRSGESTVYIKMIAFKTPILSKYLQVLTAMSSLS